MIVVHYRVKSDAEAKRIHTLLQTVGYEPRREAGAPNVIEYITRRHKLTERESEVLDLVISQGVHPWDVAERLGVERATVKWHMHNIFAKTNTANREALLRLLIKTQAEVKH